MDYTTILLAFVFLLMYSLFSKAIEKTILSGPFLALLFGFIVGPAVLDLFKTGVDREEYKIIAELTLALVLFSDASKTKLKVVKENASIPIRLLLIGLPLTILFGMLGGKLLFDEFSWIELGILATMLAPTDAALGKAVVSNNSVPSKIRESLNIESGLNDGISVPILFLFIALVESTSGSSLNQYLGMELFIKEIGVGALVGLSVTYIFVKVLNYSERKGWMTDSWQQITLITLAFSCFIIAQLMGGSGFIACFLGGLLFGTMKLQLSTKMKLLEPMEGLGDAMSLITWILFGTIIAAYANHFTWHIIIYALLSLSIIRMLAVSISLINSGLNRKEKLFIGWFGPRGLATIVFAIIVLDIEFPHKEVIILTTVCTILLSVVLHGLSANPLIKKLFISHSH